MIYCGKCKKKLVETGDIYPTFSKCTKCNFEVYEVSGW